MKPDRHSGIVAAREHLLSGKPMTRLEAMVLFGVPDLTKIISDLRREGCVVHTRSVSFIAAMMRVNEHAVLQPPANLPVKEIVLTDYRIGR